MAVDRGGTSSGSSTPRGGRLVEGEDDVPTGPGTSTRAANVQARSRTPSGGGGSDGGGGGGSTSTRAANVQARSRGGGPSGGGGGGGGGTSSSGSSTARQIPGGYELWRVGGNYRLAYQVPTTDTYMTWDIEDNDRLQEIFGSSSPPIDQRMTNSQYRRRSPLRMGLSAELQNTSEHPWRQFMSNFNEEAERRPWLKDPTVIATMAGAYLEGRTPTQDELAETDWWDEHTAEDRQLMEYSVTAGRAQLQERLREEARTMLGPEFGNLSRKRVDRWAKRVDRNPDDADEFIDLLEKQNRALFKDYYDGDEGPVMTYEDITQPFRTLGTKTWGRPFDDEQMLVGMANQKDFTEASKTLRKVGIDRGVDKVVDDALGGLDSTALGEDVVRSQV